MSCKQPSLDWDICPQGIISTYLLAKWLAEVPRGLEVPSLQPGHTETLNWNSLLLCGRRPIRTLSEIMFILPSNWNCTVKAVLKLKHPRISCWIDSLVSCPELVAI
jgi:hypothetical protein